MTDPSHGGAGNCSVCSHPGVLIVNAILTEGRVSLDGQEFRSHTSLINYLNKKFPNSYPLKPHNVSRHKPHLAGFDQGTAMILRGNKLFRPGPNGEMAEIRQFEPEIALRIIISAGLDALVTGRMRLGAKTLVDAIKIYADITANKEDPDAYDKIIAERHKGSVLDGTSRPINVDELLDSVPQVDIPPDLAAPEVEDDEEE